MSLSLTEREPLVIRAAVVGFLTAVVHLVAVLFLLPEDVEGAAAGVIDGIGLVLLLFLARPALVPAAKVVTRVTTAGEVVAGEAATAPTGSRVEIVGAYPPTVGAVKVNPDLVDVPSP